MLSPLAEYDPIETLIRSGHNLSSANVSCLYFNSMFNNNLQLGFNKTAFKFYFDVLPSFYFISSPIISWNSKRDNFCSLRRLERVFRCCSVCEAIQDYKEGYLMVWTNCMSPCSSIVGLYFKGTCDVISVTMATHKVHKSVL